MRNIILGTDWWTDCDDAVAVRVLSKFVKNGEINLKGVIINACMEYSFASLKGFLKAEGVENIPIAIDLKGTDFGGSPSYQKRLKETFAPDLSNPKESDPVKLYRKILSETEGKVEIIEIGYLQVVAALLESKPDEYSDKCGIDLVKEKVEKFWVMAGKWDKQGEKENNFCRNERSRKAGRIFCELCPVPTTFLGWEAGVNVITGGKLFKEDHLYKVLCDHGSFNGRSSWDPMLMLLAIIGDEAKAGYSVVKGKAKLNAETGENYFEEKENGLHQYVVKKFENSYYENLINDIIKQK